MNQLLKQFSKPTHIAALASFRFIFGLILFAGVLRFALNGWITDLYVSPTFFFKYYGFEFIQPLGSLGMHLVFIVMGISFFLVAIGYWYRLASIMAFLSFTYVELIDKTNYLNHYYFVSLVCFILIFLPADRFFSLRTIIKPSETITKVPAYQVNVLKLQLGIVYFFAGIAKLNADWMTKALPLKIWLPAKANLPIIGPWLSKTWVAYVFSWFGAFYDLLIPFFLLIKKYRSIAYFFVVVFHLATYFLFQIGMFPFVMIGATVIFFSTEWHLKNQQRILKLFKIKPSEYLVQVESQKNKMIMIGFAVFFFFQLIFPFRFMAYPGKLFWTEQGYRFSWRVMLMEKAGYATFHITNPANGRSWEVNNYDYLTPNQEKMMSTQADMIIQFAHYLEKEYQSKGISNPIITVECYVTLNGSQAQLLIDPTLDLTKVNDTFAPKSWILPFNPKL
jgi:hypothetical protein